MPSPAASQPDAWTPRRIAQWATDAFEKLGIVSARLDAELLISHALGISRMQLYLDLDRPLTQAERDALRLLVARRLKHEPVAYIVGYKDFYGLRFAVNSHVLIPRPETERVVDAALDAIQKFSEPKILDLCTGSGTIAIAIATKKEDASIDASDISDEALTVARKNAEKLRVSERVRFLSGDLWQACEEGARYDLVVSNPPYVATNEFANLQSDIREHEPRIALAGGADGCDFYRRIVSQAPGRLKSGGHLVLELGDGELELVRQIVADVPGLEERTVIADLTGKSRVLRLQSTSV